MQLHLALRFDYGVTMPWVTQLADASGLSAIAGPSQVVLRSPVRLQGKDFARIRALARPARSGAGSGSPGFLHLDSVGRPSELVSRVAGLPLGPAKTAAGF
jgi:hypothetical protein